MKEESHCQAGPCTASSVQRHPLMSALRFCSCCRSKALSSMHGAFGLASSFFQLLQGPEPS
eukprot:1160820-Pelagomonas_calceolata.AAC.8